MGNLCTAGATQVDAELRNVSRIIDADLRSDKKFIDSLVEILLLGAGETGKSTFGTQLQQILDDKAFASDSARRKFADPLRTNLLQSTHVIVDPKDALGATNQADEIQMMIEGAPSKDPRAVREALGRVRSKFAAEMSESCANIYDYNVVKKDTQFIKDVVTLCDLGAEGLRRVMDAHPARLQDRSECARYVIEHAARILVDDYVPTLDDILRMRVRTTGVKKIELPMDKSKSHTIRVVDVGGQRSERRKWASCFSGVSAIIFFASLIEYDQACIEDNRRNRMIESLDVFASTVNVKDLRESVLILFLNKNDLFEDKTASTDGLRHAALRLGELFLAEEPGGGDDSANAQKSRMVHAPNKIERMRAQIGQSASASSVRKFIEERYTELVQPEGREVYVHVTTAVSTTNIKTVYDACKNIILQKAI